MARPTHVYTINYVATLIGENLELLEEIASNSDNIDYGEMIHVYDGTDVSVRRTHFRVSRDGIYRPRFISSAMMRSIISGSHCVSMRNSRIPPSHVLMSASRL